MKKLSLLLALMLSLCSFTACGDSDDSEEKDSSSVSQNDKDDDEKKSSSVSKKDKEDEDDGEKKSSPDSEKDKDDEEKDNDDDDKKSMEFSRGKVENNVYTNEFSGITFETPDDWHIYSDEEIRETMGIGLEAGGSSLDADKIAEAAVVDFAAVNMGTGENVTITFEDVSRMLNGYSIGKYISGFKLSTKVSMPNAEIDWHDEGEKDTLCGMEFTTLSADIKIEDYNVDMTQEYYIGRFDDYMVSIVYSSGFTSNSMEDYKDCFKD